MDYQYPKWVWTEDDKVRHDLNVTHYLLKRPGYPSRVVTAEDRDRFNNDITHYHIQMINKTIEGANRIIEKTKKTLDSLVRFPRRLRGLASAVMHPPATSQGFLVEPE